MYEYAKFNSHKDIACLNLIMQNNYYKKNEGGPLNGKE